MALGPASSKAPSISFELASHLKKGAYPSLLPHPLLALRAASLTQSHDPKLFNNDDIVDEVHSLLAGFLVELWGSEWSLGELKDGLHRMLSSECSLTETRAEGLSSCEKIWTRLSPELQSHFQEAWGNALQRVLTRVRKTSRNRVWIRRRAIIDCFSRQMSTVARGEAVAKQFPKVAPAIKAKSIISVLYAQGIVKKRGPLKVSDNVMRRDVQLIKRVFDEELETMMHEEGRGRWKAILDWACEQLNEDDSEAMAKGTWDSAESKLKRA